MQQKRKFNFNTNFHTFEYIFALFAIISKIKKKKNIFMHHLFFFLPIKWSKRDSGPIEMQNQLQ